MNVVCVCVDVDVFGSVYVCVKAFFSLTKPLSFHFSIYFYLFFVNERLRFICISFANKINFAWFCFYLGWKAWMERERDREKRLKTWWELSFLFVIFGSETINCELQRIFRDFTWKWICDFWFRYCAAKCGKTDSKIMWRPSSNCSNIRYEPAHFRSGPVMLFWAIKLFYPHFPIEYSILFRVNDNNHCVGTERSMIGWRRTREFLFVL